ncbi:phytoene synthase [Gracilibacillus boraciitolerans JCM 21714]|uniref:Phytoene synthase n=1 Tax=Gracilibacillus boraciitolerans JCM 21714 TaxID=1298598 RepID=W4VJD9_9BACI|nr:phytoene/squalene synthase family protein [Gracilibacillus boraciitolerans]GAE92913.1 phytoene synthase [Gracilibacillus boraciitolerans JCM 21714]
MNAMQREEDFYYCEMIIKKHSKSFYYAFSKLPTEKANAVYAIYAFCRKSDDITDGNYSVQNKIKALNQLKSELDLFRNHEELDQPLWRALRHVFHTYNMDIQPFYDQLWGGQSMDVNFVTLKTMHELERYCYYVAGSVGLMLLPVIASKNSNVLQSSSVELGTAMQITNILRDVGEDFYDKGRIYLPADYLSCYKYTYDDLRNGIINQNFINIWEKLAGYAESLYHRFLLDIDQFDKDSQRSVYLSVQVYKAILDAVRGNDYDCLSKRNYVTVERILEIERT